MKRPAHLCLIGSLALLGLEVFLWFAVARHTLLGTAWTALLVESLADAGDAATPGPCVSVEPELFEQTPQRDRARVRIALEEHGVELAIAAPTHSPETGGYRDRPCTEIFRAPEKLEGLNLPIVAIPRIAYYTYDFNGDAILMVQFGTRWVYVAHWNSWM